jgi:MFS family permease
MPRPTWLNRNVAGMTLTSLFSDACYEMVLAILPGFLPVVGITAAALGWIEGFSDAFSSFLKLASGWWSDRIGKRKGVIVVGYLFTGTGLSLCAFAHSWAMILLARMVSWFGKGIRGSLRDVMLAESVPADVRGKAVGFHRAGDTVGAILGPLAGVWLLSVLPHQPPDAGFRMVFLFSLIPGLAAPLAFAALVKETLKQPGEKQRLWTAVRSLPKPYFQFMRAVGIFGAGDFSPTLFILAASTLLAPRYGRIHAAQIGALLYVVRNIVYAAGAFPVGALADRYSKTKILAGGYALGGLTAFAMAVAFSGGIESVALLAIIFVFAGLFAAIQDTLEGAIPPDLVPEAPKGGTAYGLLGAVNGVGDLIASATVGTVWTLVSPQAAFGIAALPMLIGARLMAKRR